MRWASSVDHLYLRAKNTVWQKLGPSFKISVLVFSNFAHLHFSNANSCVLKCLLICLFLHAQIALQRLHYIADIDCTTGLHDIDCTDDLMMSS